MQIKDFELKDETVLEIGKFAVLWNCFEDYWCDKDCNPKMIRSISDSIHIDEDKLSNLAKVLNEHRDWYGLKEIEYVQDALHPEGAKSSTKEDQESMCDFLKQQGDNLNCGCLLAINRIRNNLMHGIKVPRELDRQIELFRAANEVLENIR